MYWPWISAPDFDLAPAAFESQTANDVSLESADDCRFFCSSGLTGWATPCISVSQMLHTIKHITGVSINCIRLLLSTSGAIPKRQSYYFQHSYIHDGSCVMRDTNIAMFNRQHRRQQIKRRPQSNRYACS